MITEIRGYVFAVRVLLNDRCEVYNTARITTPRTMLYNYSCTDLLAALGDCTDKVQIDYLLADYM